MGIIFRYTFRELGLTFFIGFVVLTCLLLVIGLVQEALNNHFPLIYLVLLAPYVFADMSAISLPVTLLLSVTIFFSRMSGNNEITALKALGVPPRAFLIPVFAFSVFISVIGVGINEWAITWGRKGVNDIATRAAEDIFLNTLRQNNRFVIPEKQITVLVGGVGEQGRLVNVTVILAREAVTLQAQTAQVTLDIDANVLKLEFENARMSGGIAGGSPHRILEIPFSDFVSIGERQSASNMSLREIHEARQDARERIEQQRRTIAAHWTFTGAMGSVDDWAAPEIGEAKQAIRQYQRRHERLSVEAPRRWASGFCCFFFVLLGAPLAIWMRKSDFFSSFFACFVPILVLYYPLLMLGLQQAKNGTLPPMCVWIANIVIGLIGLWFLRQIHRY